MGLRFRQSFKLFPGVRINVGKRGISASIGIPGATVNINRHGARATVGLPGSGLSYSQELLKWRNGGQQDGQPYPEPQYYLPPSIDGMRPITSAGVEYLTSDSLIPLRDLIITAREQRKEVCEDLLAARELATKQANELRWKQKPLFRWMFKKRIAALNEALPVTLAEVERLEEWERQTHIKVDFDAGNYPQLCYSQLETAFDALSKSRMIWDVTADRATDRVAERTAAGRIVDLKPVRFSFSANDLLKFDGCAMRFANANGGDILIYPGMALIPGDGEAFALIDLRELEITGVRTNFHETGTVPDDAPVIGHTWAKCNKDGSRDKRFTDNYQIPIALYGRLTLTTNTGLNEEYILSNAAAVEEFNRAVYEYKRALTWAEEEAEFMAAIPD